jgi:hypothetical protein
MRIYIYMHGQAIYIYIYAYAYARSIENVRTYILQIDDIHIRLIDPLNLPVVEKG